MALVRVKNNLDQQISFTVKDGTTEPFPIVLPSRGISNTVESSSLTEHTVNLINQGVLELIQ